MKKYFFISVCALFITNRIAAQTQSSAEAANVQQPEKIYSKNRLLRSNDYYLHQMELWKKEVDKDPKNADAWFNYYKANRNSYIIGEEKDSLNAKGINRFERLKKIVSGMEQNVPATFEYNYVKWANGNNDLSLFPYLEKAYTLAPERTETFMSLAYYYELKGDYTLKNKYAKAYYDSEEFSPGLLNFGYNVLAGLEKNAIVFTEGDKDTDAILQLQAGKGIRTDVKLINMNLLLVKEYRERIFKELEIPPFDLDPFQNDENYEKYRASVIEHFAQNKKNRPLYLAVTVTDPYKKEIKDKLYLTGLTYLYSTTKVDNIALLKKNFEQQYALDYLKVYLPHDISVEMMHRFNGNYLSGLNSLSEHYASIGDHSKADYYNAIAQKINDDSPDKEKKK